MTQIDPKALQGRTPPGAVPERSKEPSSPVQANEGAALYAAEPVVAPAEKKKAAARAGSGSPMNRIPNVRQDEGTSHGATDDAVVGRQDFDMPHAVAADTPDADALKAAPARERKPSSIVNPKQLQMARGAQRGDGRANRDDVEDDRCGDIHGAVVIDAKKEADTITPGWSEDTQEPVEERTTIPGINDRAHHLAMVAHAGTPLLRPPKLTTRKTVNALKPKSRAECERRCGSRGICDASNELGCGGIYCGRAFDKL